MLGPALDLLTAAIAFLLAAFLYRPLIPWLRRLRAGQVIQAELPASHQRKAGTPTGGGMLFILLAIVGGVLATGRGGHSGALPAVAALALFGLIGLSDDLRKLRVGSIGIPARAKFPLQVLFAVPVAWLAHSAGGDHQHLPFQLGWTYWPLAVIAIVGAANAVNLTDGMDGLAGGLSLIAFAFLALGLGGAVAGEKAVAMVLCGGLAAFLVFNRFPARIFMGDVGSLGLGAALAAMAIQQGYLLLLPLIGLVFVIETLSVIIQVAYFKASGGRRIFKMTPIHYTFHLEGWSENRIDVAFWGAGIAVSLASLLVARALA